jgi:hypothetical protein
MIHSKIVGSLKRLTNDLNDNKPIHSTTVTRIGQANGKPVFVRYQRCLVCKSDVEHVVNQSGELMSKCNCLK